MEGREGKERGKGGRKEGRSCPGEIPNFQI
jgi:hypothetical protein